MAFEWFAQTPPVESWRAVAWSPQRQRFAAVMGGQAADGKHAMTSPDGETWTKRDLANALVSDSWVSLAWSADFGLFFGGSGGGGAAALCTSEDGITWDTHLVIGTTHALTGTAASPEVLIVLGTVGASGIVYRSLNGSTWTNPTLAGSLNRQWKSVAYSPSLQLFAAVAQSGTGDRVMTSPDGSTWTSQTSAADQAWTSIAWASGPSLFVAVSNNGTQRVMTSPDGETWTLRDTPSHTWNAVTWGSAWQRAIAVANDGATMFSADGVTWTMLDDPPNLNSWQGITYSADLRIFCAVSSNGTGRAITSSPAPLPADPRHWGDQLMLTLFAKESPYNTSPAFGEETACSMHGFDDQAAHEAWDDTVDDDEATVHGHEYPTVQVIIRQSVRWDYREPRVVPNTLAGLMGLGLGHITSDQDEALAAYRHRLRPVTSVGLPSISAQTRHAGGLQYRYPGIKSDGFTLAASGAYLSFACPLIGSGARELSDTDFLPMIDEPWLKWGDAQVFIVEAAAALTLPSDPAQGETNLGATAVNLSSRLRQWSLTHGNALAADAGYRPSTGLYRGAFHPVRRGTTLTLEVDCQDDAEALLLDHYLSQTPLACELNLDTGLVIAEDGAYRYGLVLILPRLRLRRVRRQEADQFDTLALEGRVQSDGTNPVLQAWVYNAQAAYLA